jgi:hypothetical protein
MCYNSAHTCLIAAANAHASHFDLRCPQWLRSRDSREPTRELQNRSVERRTSSMRGSISSASLGASGDLGWDGVEGSGAPTRQASRKGERRDNYICVRLRGVCARSECRCLKDAQISHTGGHLSIAIPETKVALRARLCIPFPHAFSQLTPHRHPIARATPTLAVSTTGRRPSESGSPPPQQQRRRPTSTGGGAFAGGDGAPQPLTSLTPMAAWAAHEEGVVSLQVGGCM